MTTDQQKQFWNQAAQSKNLRDDWIIDKEVTTQDCIDAITKPLGDSKPTSILEIGCGIGRLTTEVKKIYPKAFVTGIDISPEMLKKAEEHSGWLANSQLSGSNWLSPAEFPFYYETDGKSIPGSSDHFDLIYSMVVFQHIPESGVISYINEAARVLKKNGVFRFQYIEGTEQEDFSRRYQHDQMIQWLGNAGFKVASIERGLVHELWTWVTAIKG